MKKTLFIKDFEFKKDVETICYVKHFSLVEARDGRFYISMVMSDASGDLDSRIWSKAKEHNQAISSGDFVHVKGKLNLFQGKKQFIVQEIAKIAKNSIDLNDYTYKAQIPVQKMYDDLLDIVQGLDDYYIRTLLLSVIKNEDIAKRLKKWPAGKSIHHAYEGGLLEHILSCSQIALFLSPRYECNFNYVLAGCILHDLCKIYELSEPTQADYTDEGKLVGHLVKGVELLDRFSYKINGFPHIMRNHLKHILLSHHGEYMFGSPKIPQTSEAMLVHLIDLLDSKMNAFATIKRTDCHGVDWSHYIKHLDRMIYKSPLPHFPEPIASAPKNPTKKNTTSPKINEPLKQNLGELFKDFKLKNP